MLEARIGPSEPRKHFQINPTVESATTGVESNLQQNSKTTMLDGHDYLTKRGWAGKGTALRNGGISRPIAVSQKRTLSGLGKDRDEAFPFWEHVFDASLSTINIKIASSDTDSDDEEGGESSSSGAAPVSATLHSRDLHSTHNLNSQKQTPVALQRTVTGILSNRRPTSGTPATSGTSTPQTAHPRLSLFAIARRDAVRRDLYARFYRGPVIISLEPETPTASSPSTPLETPSPSLPPTIEPSSDTPDPSNRAAQKAERKRLRAEKRARKAASSSSGRNKKAKTADEPLDDTVPLAAMQSDLVDEEEERKKRKSERKRKRELEDAAPVGTATSKRSGSKEGKEKKKKRRREDDHTSS